MDILESVEEYIDIKPEDLTIIIGPNFFDYTILFGTGVLGRVQKAYFEVEFGKLPILQLSIPRFKPSLGLISKRLFEEDTLTIIVPNFVNPNEELENKNYEYCRIFYGKEYIKYCMNLKTQASVYDSSFDLIIDIYNTADNKISLMEDRFKQINKEKELLSKVPWIMSSNEATIKSIL